MDRLELGVFTKPGRALAGELSAPGSPHLHHRPCSVVQGSLVHGESPEGQGGLTENRVSALHPSACQFCSPHPSGLDAQLCVCVCVRWGQLGRKVDTRVGVATSLHALWGPRGPMGIGRNEM